MHFNNQCRNGIASLLQDGTKKSAQPGFVSAGGSSGGANANSQPDRTVPLSVAPSTAGRPRTGQQAPTATRGRPRTRTRLSRTREVEVRAAAADNGTRLSATLAPDERAAPVAPLWETEAANDARRRWEDNIEELVQQSNALLQQMHQMITDKFAGDNVGPRSNNLGHDDDVLLFPQMSHVTAMDQLGGDI